MAKYLDETGLSHFWGKLKTAFAAATHTHSASDVTSGTLNSARIPIAGTDIGGVKNGGDVYIDSAGAAFYDLGTELDALAASRAEDYDVAQGAMYYNGTGSVSVEYLPIECGGTGANNAADARVNLGITDTPKTVWFGSCSTTASTAAKVVTCSGFTLTTGAIIGVSFSTANTAATPTLNVNSTGAKSIWIGTSTPNSTTNTLKWSAYTMLYFMYDGNEYRFITAVSAGSVVPRGANTWYATCTTAAATAAKVGTCANFVLTRGALVSVTFTYANTATTPTLNVNSTGAKSIYASNAAGSASNPITWDANDTLTFIYSGSYFYLVARDSASGGSVEPATAAPLADGTASVGASDKYAREDHVHPSDTTKQDALVSGTNIKTINGESLLGSGDISTAETSKLSGVTLSTSADTYVVPVTGGIANLDVGNGLKVSDASSRVTLSAKIGTTSTTVAAGNHTHSGYQATLVSGTNIKTVNGTSLLGSGDISTAELPSVSSSDNGKVLRVVSGAWAAASLPTATSTTLGGVMVGSGLNIENGVLSTVFPGVRYETSGDGWSIYEIGTVKICTKTITGSLAVTTSYGGRYISALQSVTFPSEYLQEVVYADVVAASSPGIFWTAKTAISDTSMSYYVVANTSLTQNVTRRLIAIGAY